MRWHVWHERRYSATSQSWPTQKARSLTSDPVLARPKCPQAGRHGSRGAPVRATCHQRGCNGGPQRPVCGGRGGRNALETFFRVCAGSVTGAPCRLTSLPSAAAAPRRILRDPVFRPLRLEPRHRPAVCPQVELRKSVQSPAGRAPRCREGSVGTPVGRGPLPVWCSSARPPSACDSRTPPPAPSLANFNRQIIF